MSKNRMEPKLEQVIERDRMLRQMIAEYYMALSEMKDPSKAVELLASHVAIMVEMINEFKKGR